MVDSKESEILLWEISKKERCILEAAGVKFSGSREGGITFQEVKLPQGWKKVPADHPKRCSKLVDDKGRERADILFYETLSSGTRVALIMPLTRFSSHINLFDTDSNLRVITYITDGGKVIHQTKSIRLPVDEKKKGKAARRAWKVGGENADKWLDQKYPDWRNPGAYWD